MPNLKKLTILHSNDLHGDFLAEEIDSKLVGGVSMLSGYVNKVRNEEKNAIYCIAGDMFRGSVIDSEYQGVSTIEIMNMLSPDVVTVGNHETDYGISHLLFFTSSNNFSIFSSLWFYSKLCYFFFFMYFNHSIFYQLSFSQRFVSIYVNC